MILCALIASQAQSALKTEDLKMFKDLKDFVQTHAVLSGFLSVVVNYAYLYEYDKIKGCAQIFRQSCESELSSCTKRVVVVHSLVQKLWTIDEEHSSSQECGYVVPDAAQGLNAMPYFEAEFATLQEKQRKHATDLVNFFSKRVRLYSTVYTVELERYLQSVNRLGNHLKKLSANLALMQEKTDRMVVVLHNFAQTQRKIKDWGVRVCCWLDVLSRSKLEGLLASKRVVEDQALLQENLLKLESTAFKIQIWDKNLTDHEEGKGEVQEYRIPHDVWRGLETYLIEYQGLKSHQQERIIDLNGLLDVLLVDVDFFKELRRNRFNYASNLRKTEFILNLLVKKLKTYQICYADEHLRADQ